MVTFDSLCLRMLPNYGNREVIAPGFEELGKRCTRFDNCYAGSLPCIPARREMHTGRENFLHSRWGALEPYDDSMPELLKQSGVYTHLVTDHTHYWEDEGFGYHCRYQSFQFIRGQEGDPVYGKVDTMELQSQVEGRRVPYLRVQDAVNRSHWKEKEDFPQFKTFQSGLDFLKENCQSDNWFLHIETFDPHEPFCAPDEFRVMYGLKTPSDQESDWPDYKQLTDSESFAYLKQYRKENMALVSFCSYHLEKILKAMDQYGLWNDTMLIVNTDHGFLLGEHGWLGKNTGPYYNEIVHIPLFLYDPRYKRQQMVNEELIQTVDIPATILDFFGVQRPDNMTGRAIKDGMREIKREFAFWGLFGGQLNVTDGRYIYMRAPVKEGQPACYTMAGQHFMRSRVQCGKEPYQISMGPVFTFTKGYPLMRIENMGNDFQTEQDKSGNMLFDLKNDPRQEQVIRDDKLEKMFCSILKQWLIQMDAPNELYKFYGLCD